MSTQAQIAEHLDLTTRQIRNLLSDGTLPGGVVIGGLDIDACRLAYIRYQRDLVNKQKNRPLSELEGEKLRLTRAQAERAEKENRVAAGELIPVSMYQDALVALASEMVRALSSLPGRLAGELAGISEPAVMRDRLMKEVNTIRNAIAGHCEDFANRIEEIEKAADAEDSLRD
jgi:terminase small subunit / prophage DNA-packing protein